MAAATAWTAPTDVVETFVSSARSAAHAGDDSLRAAVNRHDLLVGAAVGDLLDQSFDAAQRGDAGEERECLQLARRLATIHEKISGSGTPLSLVETYESWTSADRRARQRAIRLEAEADAARQSGELDRSVELYDEARSLYEQIGDRHSIAVIHGSLGVAYWQLGNMGKVYQHYQKALEERRAVEDHILEGKTLNGLGSANYRIGNYQGAVDFYRQAIALRERTGDLSGLGTSLTYLGNAYYQMGRLIDARDQFERAIAILQDGGDAEQTFDVLNGMASLYSDMGRFAASNDTYRRAVDIAAQSGLTDREIMARRNLADNLRRTFGFREALAQLDSVDALLSEHSDATQRALLHRDRGATRMNMGELDAARVDLLAFLDEAKRLDNPSLRLEALINVGYLYRELGAYDRALGTAAQARELAASLGDGRNQRLALALSGAVQHSTGDYRGALESWQAALALDEKAGAEQTVLADKASLATERAAVGEIEAARREFYALLPEARAFGLDQVEWSIEFGIGHTFEEENPDSAVAHYETALALIERVGSAIGGQEVRTGYLSGRRRFYYEEVARYYASRHAREGEGWSARAFDTMERAKATGLVRLLQSSVAGEGSAAEDSVLEALYGLDESAPGYAERRGDLERRYAELREERVQRTFGGLLPGGAAALDEIRAKLPKGTALLEYALGDSVSLLWVVDRKGHELVTIPPRPRLESEVERLRDALTRPGAGDEVVRRTSRELYRILVEPARNRIDRAAELVVVPDGALFELPFEALLTEDPDDDAPWSEQPFLARKKTVTYAPSATVYLQLEGRRDGADYALDLLAVGDPDFSGLRVGGAGALEPLPYTESEVKGISASVRRSRVLEGAGASESALKRQMQAGAPRVLHLATHGLVDAAEPTESSIALAADGVSGEDGYLHTLEILSMRCRTGLVVMSACESARGKVSRGEGVVGLGRAFIASGARAVVASLWSVSDESTAELMKVFYENMMGKRQPAGEALNRARLALIDGGRFAHPFYWSPFVVIGAGNAPW